MSSFRRARYASLPALLLALATASGQSADLPIRVLHATAGHDAQRATAGEAYRDSTEVIAALQMRLREADPKLNGHVWLEFSADTGNGPHANSLTIRIPLASTDAPQADAGACTNGPRGTRRFSFNAAADPGRSVPFQPASRTTSLELSLNQYLCRALAAQYTCDGTPETLPQN